MATKSVEPRIAELGNGWLKSYKDETGDLQYEIAVYYSDSS